MYKDCQQLETIADKNQRLQRAKTFSYTQLDQISLREAKSLKRTVSLFVINLTYFKYAKYQHQKWKQQKQLQQDQSVIFNFKIEKHKQAFQRHLKVKTSACF